MDSPRLESWDDSTSQGGTNISTGELQEAIHVYKNNLPDPEYRSRTNELQARGTYKALARRACKLKKQFNNDRETESRFPVFFNFLYYFLSYFFTNLLLLYFSFSRVCSTPSPIFTFIRKSSTVARREPIFSE